MSGIIAGGTVNPPEGPGHMYSEGLRSWPPVTHITSNRGEWKCFWLWVDVQFQANGRTDTQYAGNGLCQAFSELTIFSKIWSIVCPEKFDKFSAELRRVIDLDDFQAFIIDLPDFISLLGEVSHAGYYFYIPSFFEKFSCKIKCVVLGAPTLSGKKDCVTSNAFFPSLLFAGSKEYLPIPKKHQYTYAKLPYILCWTPGTGKTCKREYAKASRRGNRAVSKKSVFYDVTDKEFKWKESTRSDALSKRSCSDFYSPHRLFCEYISGRSVASETPLQKGYIESGTLMP